MMPANARLASAQVPALACADGRCANCSDPLRRGLVPCGAGSCKARTDLGPILVATALGDHVGDIVSLSAEEQVIRPNAGAVVTPMANKEALRDVAMGERPRIAVSHQLSMVDRQSPIAVAIALAAPLPAVRRLDDAIPEAVLGRGRHPQRVGLPTLLVAPLARLRRSRKGIFTVSSRRIFAIASSLLSGIHTPIVVMRLPIG